MAKGAVIWEVDPRYFIVAVTEQNIAWAIASIRQIILRYVPKFEAYLKREANWIDRSANLRQSLFSRLEEESLEIAVVIGYGMDYGDYVVLGHQGRYDVISWAMDYFRPKIFADIEALFR